MSEQYLPAHTSEPLSAPIVLVPYDPAWPDTFQRRASEIRSALGERAVSIEHVGSTSVPDMPAKPTIDILLVVAESTEEMQYAPALEGAGYKLHLREPGWHEHRLFKGLENDVNLHVFSTGCPEVARMLIFRDWLRTNKADLELYARCKLSLAQQRWKYTQDYADAKTPVINEIMSRARGSEDLKGG